MNHRAVAVVDLGFGDAGKGLVVDYLARRGSTGEGAGLVVRFNGGAQAAHNVVTPDGRHHAFAQLGAGTFVPGVRTHLASRVVVHPTGLLVEAARLATVGVTDALDRVTVSPDAWIVTPFHQAACRVRELARGSGGRHGSCGVGVGEVMADGLGTGRPVRARDLRDPGSLRRLLEGVQERIRESLRGEREAARRDPGGHDELAVLDDPSAVDRWIDATRAFATRIALVPDRLVGEALARGHRVIFEGAQGVLLDEDYGFHPYTTWSRCTFANAVDLLADACPGQPLFRLGVARVYAHRHGPGPLPTESPELAGRLVERHNVAGPWQGHFRVGWPDLVLVRYSVAAAGGVDGLALTHLDAFERAGPWRIATAYDGGRLSDWPLLPPADLSAREDATRRLMKVAPDLAPAGPGDVEDALCAAYGAPLVLRSFGPVSSDVREGPPNPL